MTQYQTTVIADHLRSFETIQAEVTDLYQAGKMQLDVLWWFESKFSPSLLCGYRELPQTACALAMVCDLAEIIPALSPVSVTYMLGESMATALPPAKRTKRFSIESLLTSLVDEGTKVKKLLPDKSGRQGRVPILELVIEAAGGNNIASEIRQRTGLDPSLQITLQEFAMWAFRNLQAQRLVEVIK
jgi:hypothetical protein